MAIDSADIEAYIDATGKTHKRTSQRIREVLGIFSVILDERGIPRPDAEAYEALRVELKRKAGHYATQAYPPADNGVEQARGYFAWHDTQKGADNVVEDDVIDTEVTDSEVTRTDAAVSAGSDTQSRRTGGRKRLDPSGEKRTEKVMLYLTPTRYVDLHDLASLYGLTMTDYVISLIERDLEARREKLATFRELRRD